MERSIPIGACASTAPLPTSALPTQMSWSAHQYQFNAFLDPDGTVKQLDINLQSLSDAEKTAPRCGDVRTRKSMAAKAAASKKIFDTAKGKM